MFCFPTNKARTFTTRNQEIILYFWSLTKEPHPFFFMETFLSISHAHCQIIQKWEKIWNHVLFGSYKLCHSFKDANGEFWAEVKVFVKYVTVSNTDISAFYFRDWWDEFRPKLAWTEGCITKQNELRDPETLKLRHVVEILTSSFAPQEVNISVFQGCSWK